MIDLSNRKLPLKVIFWGYHWSGWETYTHLKRSTVFKVVGIVLPTNRSHETIDNLRAEGKNTGVPVFEPGNLSDPQFINSLSGLSADLHFVDSYSKLIPKKILDITGLGFNLHPGLLPKYRGAHVLNWVLINGEKESGLSLHLLTDKFDEGDVICSARTEIGLTDSAAILDKKLIGKIPELINKLEAQISRGKIEFQKQEGESKHWPARTPKDSEILDHETAIQIHNKIRAVSYPWNGAYLLKSGIKLTIWESYPSEKKFGLSAGSFVENDHEVYYIAADKKSIIIKCINAIDEEEHRPLMGDDILKELSKAGIPVEEKKEV